jgi:Flp pilus assembly pilin Flp
MDECGQGMLEYVLIIALVAVVAIIALFAVRSFLNNRNSGIQNTLNEAEANMTE